MNSGMFQCVEEGCFHSNGILMQTLLLRQRVESLWLQTGF